MRKLERLRTFILSEVFDMVDLYNEQTKNLTRVEAEKYACQIVDEKRIKVCSQRLQLFRKNHRCVCCGETGVFFAAERSANAKQYHLNLYGKRPNGDDLLFTQDHIIDRVAGGADNMSNLQTMCTTCNYNKAVADREKRAKELK